MGILQFLPRVPLPPRSIGREPNRQIESQKTTFTGGSVAGRAATHGTLHVAAAGDR